MHLHSFPVVTSRWNIIQRLINERRVGVYHVWEDDQTGNGEGG